MIFCTAWNMKRWLIWISQLSPNCQLLTQNFVDFVIFHQSLWIINKIITFQNYTVAQFCAILKGILTKAPKETSRELFAFYRPDIAIFKLQIDVMLWAFWKTHCMILLWSVITLASIYAPLLSTTFIAMLQWFWTLCLLASIFTIVQTNWVRKSHPHCGKTQPLPDENWKWATLPI